MSLGRIVEHHGDRFATRPALAFGEKTVSYAELRDSARATAGMLRSLGVERGDVVSVLLYNSLEFVDLMVASAYLGAIFMPLNFRLAGAELSYIINHAGTKVLFCEPDLQALIDPVRSELTCDRYVSIAAPPTAGWESLSDLLADNQPVMSPEVCAPDDLLRLMYTSGTTARPKGVMIAHGNLDAKCLAQIIELGLSAEDRSLIAGPLYHVGALDLTFTTVLYLGGRQRILRTFDAPAVLDWIEKERLTTVWLAPAMVNLLMNEPTITDRDLTSVRSVLDGGEKMPLPLIERVLTAFPNAWFADAYGLTETVGGDTYLNKGEERRKLGSVGKPVFNADVAIVDAEGNRVEAGETGEIVLRGPKVSPGYWRDADATKSAIRNGWFHTGDIGLIDTEGYLYIVDRIKDMIISGGENIASLEVERVLYEHNAVREVAVIGRPDARWGEVPVAYVVLHPGADTKESEIITFCAERLAKFKAPKAVHFVDELPRNPSGKVLKRSLRELENVK